jgi:hypothetical protein
LKNKKIISSFLGLLIVLLMLTQLMARTSAQKCYAEQPEANDTNTKTLTLLDKCGSTTSKDTNGAQLNASDCYYEQNVLATINGTTNTTYTKYDCTTLLCQGGSALSNGQNCPPQDPCDPTLKTPYANSSALCSNIVQNYINPIILFLGAGVGLVIVIMVVIGGIEYTTSGGDPKHVAEAKNRIANALLALIAWIIIWAFLEWIIPGGLFH